MKRVIAENARWNLGGIHRNINTPTLVLWFLTDEMSDHFRFRVVGGDRLASGEPCDAYSLQEVGTPLMQVDGAATAASGQICVLRDTGEVVKTTLTLERGRSAEVQARAQVDVTYLRDSRLNFWVPAMMVERYEYPKDREADTLTAKAEYSGTSDSRSASGSNSAAIGPDEGHVSDDRHGDGDMSNTIEPRAEPLPGQRVDGGAAERLGRPFSVTRGGRPQLGRYAFAFAAA